MTLQNENQNEQNSEEIVKEIKLTEDNQNNNEIPHTHNGGSISGGLTPPSFCLNY